MATQQLNGHILYHTGDDDVPDSICDRNGDVVLGLCKYCGRGEIELSEPCDVTGEDQNERV